MFFSTSITTKLHATTLASALLVGATAVGLFLAFGVLNKRYTLLSELQDQRSCAAALGRLSSEVTLRLEGAIYKDDSSGVSGLLAKSESLQSTFSAFRDSAVKHQDIEAESFATEAEPTIYALRNDIVKCVTLLRKGKQSEAQAHFSRVVVQRVAPIQHFVELSVYAKDMRIDEETRELASLQKMIFWVASVVTLGMVGLVALINARIGNSITRPLASLIQSTRRLASGD